MHTVGTYLPLHSSDPLKLNNNNDFITLYYIVMLCKMCVGTRFQYNCIILYYNIMSLLLCHAVHGRTEYIYIKLPFCQRSQHRV